MPPPTILNDELPIIYFGHQSWIWALNKKVTGFVPSAGRHDPPGRREEGRLIANRSTARRSAHCRECRLVRITLMYTYIAKRLLVAIPTLLIISVFVFSLQKLLPGDPILAMAGEERDPQVLEFCAKSIG